MCARHHKAQETNIDGTIGVHITEQKTMQCSQVISSTRLDRVGTHQTIHTRLRLKVTL